MAQAQPKVVELTLSQATPARIFELLRQNDCVVITPDRQRKGRLKQTLAFVVSPTYFGHLLNAPREAFADGVAQAKFAFEHEVEPSQFFIHP